jgi:hypothetical protein
MGKDLVAIRGDQDHILNAAPTDMVVPFKHVHVDENGMVRLAEIVAVDVFSVEIATDLVSVCFTVYSLCRVSRIEQVKLSHVKTLTFPARR